jgi:hypothetical protein
MEFRAIFSIGTFHIKGVNLSGEYINLLKYSDLSYLKVKLILVQKQILHNILVGKKPKTKNQILKQAKRRFLDKVFDN